jgi:hypothetical protein
MILSLSIYNKKKKRGEGLLLQSVKPSIGALKWSIERIIHTEIIIRLRLEA